MDERIKKEIKGILEFREMLADFVQKKLGKQVKYFIRDDGEGAIIIFRENLYQLFSLHISEEKKILIFSNLMKMYPSFRNDLLNLFSFLGFVIDDKSK